MNFIVAVDRNYAIGKDNDLLYSLKQDMKYFRETTLNKVVVMGDKTLMSFPNSAPLKNRTNIVVSIDPNFTADGAIVVRSFKELFEELKKYDTNDVFVIGGASIYNQLMDYCEYGYLTKIDAEKPYDKAIDNVEAKGWTLVKQGETLTENDIVITDGERHLHRIACIILIIVLIPWGNYPIIIAIWHRIPVTNILFACYYIVHLLVTLLINYLHLKPWSI